MSEYENWEDPEYPTEEDMVEYDEQMIQADRDTHAIICNTVYNTLHNGEPIDTMTSAGIEALGVARRLNIVMDFAGRLIGLNPGYPEHQAVLDAAEWYEYECENPFTNP